jgi:hypothetical protein
MPLSFTPLPDIRCRIGESPVFDERLDRLWFVDIPARQLHGWDNGGAKLRSWTFESEVCSLGLAASGRLVVALRDRVILFDPATGIAPGALHGRGGPSGDAAERRQGRPLTARSGSAAWTIAKTSRRSVRSIGWTLREASSARWTGCSSPKA